MNQAPISEADIVRSREDPRLRQVLLARSLEQLLGSMHRLQHAPGAGADNAQHLREGALVAVQIAEMIHAIQRRLRAAEKR